MSAVTIRQLTAKDDLSEATKLLIRFFREEQFDTPDEIIERNTATLAGLDTCGLFVAEAGGRIIAVATVSLEFGVEFGWGAEMGDLYVLPDWRGKGVSRRLVLAIEDFLKDRGASIYQVTVTPHARDAHDLGKFYEGLGFGSEGRLILAKPL
jgi:GNAT superfamily N-acetyltransferase